MPHKQDTETKINYREERQERSCGGLPFVSSETLMGPTVGYKEGGNLVNPAVYRWGLLEGLGLEGALGWSPH